MQQSGPEVPVQRPLTPDRFVRVVSGRAKVLPATWGQQFMWEVSERLGGGGAQLAISVAVQVPEDTSHRRIERSVQALCARHDALRTSFDGGSLASLRQRVKAEIEVPLFDATVTDGTCVRREEAQLTGHLREPGFLPGDASLLRVGVISERGLPRSVVLVLSHLVVDGWSLRQLGNELGELLGGGTLRGAAHQPDHQVTFEASAEGGELNRKALEHQHAIYASLTLRTPTDDTSRSELPRYREGTLVSHRAFEAAQTAARTFRVSVSTVMMAAVVQLLSELGGCTEITLLMWTHNRLRPDARGMVGQLTQVVPIQFDVLDMDDRALLRHVQRTVARAMTAGLYSPAGAARVRAQLEARAVDGKLPLGFRFNYIQADPTGSIAPAATNDGEFSWGMSADEEDIVASFDALEAERSLSLYVDTCFVPASEIHPALDRLGEILDGMLVNPRQGA